jgi:ferrochelatase
LRAELGVHPGFIRTLVGETLAALGMKTEIRSCAGGRLCPSDWTGCPHAVTHQKAGERVIEPAL